MSTVRRGGQDRTPAGIAGGRDDASRLLAQFCDDLRLLRLQAGGPSLRGLAVRLRLGKSQVGSILNGRIGRLPDWEVVRGVVDGCRQYAQEHGRLDRLSLATGIEQFWRPRYAMVDHALREAARGDQPAPAGDQPPATPQRVPAVPRQLPAAVRHFAGRAEPLAALSGLLDGAGTTDAVVISAIGGTAGVGKTAIAVYWAHRVADRFPDGQLYVNLRGFGPDGAALDPGEAVRRFLDAIGVPARRIPPDPDAQAALYRSELAGRRMLILLDNARDSAQVRPLLPGTPGCLVLVTSRDPLTSLVAADAAHPITLDLLTRDEAVDLLTRRLGAARVAAERPAVEEIITRCARLPLALAIVAARAATRPVPLAELARQLRDRGDRSGLLNAGDPMTDIDAVFGWSYQALTPPAARVFRLLGRHPGPDTAAPAVASLAALPLSAVRPLLAELIRANLLSEPVAGRYASHDLLRAHATQLGDTIDAEPDRRAATLRVLDHYLHTAVAATQLGFPGRDPVVPDRPAAGTSPGEFADRDAAHRWFTAERPVLLATVEHALATGHERHAWQLAWTLTGFLERHLRWPDQATVARAALAAAGRLADPHAAALGHRALARADIETGRYDDAHTNLRLALAFDTGTGDLVEQAHDQHHLAYLYGQQGRADRALEHNRQALALYRAAGHRQGEASALNGVGWYQAQAGDHRAALATCRAALALLQQLNNHAGEAATWHSVGYIHHHLGDYDDAVTCFRRALALYRDLGERYFEARTLNNLGDSQLLAGSAVAARATWRQAMAILTDLDHPDAGPLRAKVAAG